MMVLAERQAAEAAEVVDIAMNNSSREKCRALRCVEQRLQTASLPLFPCASAAGPQGPPVRAALPLPLLLALQRAACPDGCAAARLSFSASAAVAEIRGHSKQCPAMLRCRLCGYAIPPSTMQSSAWLRHVRGCGAWPVDGRLFRSLLADPTGLSASSASRAAASAIAIADAEDFPGTDRSVLLEEALVCCPHFGCDKSFPGRSCAEDHAQSCEQRMHQIRFVDLKVLQHVAQRMQAVRSLRNCSQTLTEISSLLSGHV